MWLAGHISSFGSKLRALPPIHTPGADQVLEFHLLDINVSHLKTSKSATLSKTSFGIFSCPPAASTSISVIPNAFIT